MVTPLRPQPSPVGLAMRWSMMLCLAWGGCSAPAIPDVPTGTSTIAADADGLRLTVSNPYEDTISIVNVGRQAVVSVPVGVEPTRLVVVNGRALVTLKGERAIAEVDLGTGEVLQVVPTGPEPYGIIASPDGDRVFVSVSMGERVEERDARTLERLRSFDVPGQPRWMALHPNGRTLVVASALGEQLHVVDLDDGRVSALALPEHTTEAFGQAISGEVRLAGRVTGDPVFGADGEELVVPTLYVDHTSGEMGAAEQNVPLPVPSAPYYRQGPVVDSMGRFNAAVVHYEVDDETGAVSPEAAATSRIIDVAPNPEVGGTVVRQSYLTSLTQSPDGQGWLATMEASDTVLMIHGRYKRGWQRKKRLAFPMTSVATTGRAPRGLAVSGEREVYVHEAFARSASEIPFRGLRRNLKLELDKGLESEVVDSAGEPTAHLQTPVGLRLAERVLDPDQERGRDLFYSAVSPTMGEAGVSCSTCHFEGRTDGLTWELFNGARNTPSLAGPVAQTGVVTWTNPIESVAQEAGFTVKHRMGARDLSARAAQSIQAFVDATPLPDVMDVDAAAAERGKVLFEREDVGCAACHSGEFQTDRRAYTMFGLPGVKTRPLHGIASSPPYLHDGRAQTLGEVLELSRNGAMGHTGMLNDEEMADLEAYLRSL